jgi:hypothetical protein
LSTKDEGVTVTDILHIAAVAEAQGLSLSAAKDVVEKEEEKEPKGCWNCLDPVGIRCCEFGRDV